MLHTQDPPAIRYGVPDAPDLALFRLNAVVDWIDIEVETTNATNHRGIRSRTGQSYAEAINPTQSGAATQFRVRFQNPASWADIRAALAGHQLAKPPKVVGIEIALDAYSNGASREQLLDLLAYLAWHTTALGRAEEQADGASANVRLAGAKRGLVSPLGSIRELRERLEFQSLYVGDQRTENGRPLSHEAWRFYLKTTDEKKALPEELHRARMEVTLTGEGLFSTSLADWEEYGFEKLADKFRFRSIADEVNPLVQGALKQIPVASFPPRKRRHGGGIQRNRPWTKANTPLNRRLYDALRGLTRKMSRQNKRKRIVRAEVAAQIAEHEPS